MKCHKDHVDREEACITMCNGKCLANSIDAATYAKRWKVREGAGKHA